MKATQAVHRRQFLRQTAAAGAALGLAPWVIPCGVLGAEAPSKKITVGFIGTGQHGTSWNLSSYLKQRDARVLVVCDVDREHMEFAKEKVDEQYQNKDCGMTTDFREVIAARTSMP
jgi:hypothetical protein